jgi:hypothetical protein
MTYNIKLAANSRRDPTQSGPTYAESASAAIESEKRARASDLKANHADIARHQAEERAAAAEQKLEQEKLTIPAGWVFMASKLGPYWSMRSLRGQWYLRLGRAYLATGCSNTMIGSLKISASKLVSSDRGAGGVLKPLRLPT